MSEYGNEGEDFGYSLPAVVCELCGGHAPWQPEEGPEEYGYETAVLAGAGEDTIEGTEHWICYDCLDKLVWQALHQRQNP